jgi:serine/threonine protein kinase
MLTSTWPIGHRIKGRYEIKDIKVGGMAVVYLCYDHEFREMFAVKSFKDQFLGRKDVMDRFFYEAELWMRLEKHCNIVWTRWVDRINGRPFIFLEYIEGHPLFGLDLSGWILKKGLTLELALYFAIQICSGMIYSQRKFDQMQKTFVHRDLKPANIFITSEGVAKITDFGIMKVLTEVDKRVSRDLNIDGMSSGKHSFTKIGDICGTPPYMSPEQWCEDQTVDRRSDVYSFGCVLYEMIVGHPPFLCQDFEEYKHQHLHSAPNTPAKLNATVPQDLSAITMKCLEKDAVNRYQTFEVIRDDLNNAFTQLCSKRIEYHDAGDELTAADVSNIAMSLYELGNSQEAIGYHDRIIAKLVDEVSPEMVARAFNNRANCHSALGDYKRTLMNYELAKRLDPNYDFPWFNCAGCYVSLGQYDKAIEEINQAIKINPMYADAYARRADIYLAQGNAKEAINDCTRAIALEPKHAFAFRTRARAYESIGDTYSALLDSTAASKLDGLN